MNKRIVKIAENAGMAFLFDCNSDENVLINIYDLEQFAKDIIKECANVVENYQFEPGIESSEIKDILVEQIEKIGK